jgi:hypothetical protein
VHTVCYFIDSSSVGDLGFFWSIYYSLYGQSLKVPLLEACVADLSLDSNNALTPKYELPWSKSKYYDFHIKRYI